jgi:aminopeptidase YwaD
VQRFFRLPGNDGFDAAIDSVASLLRAAGYVRETKREALRAPRLSHRVAPHARIRRGRRSTRRSRIAGRSAPLQQFAAIST